MCQEIRTICILFDTNAIWLEISSKYNNNIKNLVNNGIDPRSMSIKDNPMPRADTVFRFQNHPKGVIILIYVRMLNTRQ